MEKTSCMVSILCTAYNHEEYIAECLESFLCQKTDFAFEVLVNDDASTDGTAAIIKQYAEKYPEMIRPFFQEKNLYSQLKMPGLFAKVFYPEARGKYIALCEGDDKWCDGTKLQRQVDWLEAHGEYTACVHNTVLRFCDNADDDRLLIDERSDRDVEFSTVIQGMSRAFHTSSILARREYIVDPPEFHYVAGSYGFTDYAIGLWLTMKGKVRFIDRPMSMYRISSNPEAWSANLGRRYDKLKEFIEGECAMMRSMRPLLNAEQSACVESELILREYELYDITGQIDKLYKEPYRTVLRQKDIKYRIKTLIKKLFPALHSKYRKRQGYGDY